jgi:hypothetical protein
MEGGIKLLVGQVVVYILGILAFLGVASLFDFSADESYVVH